MKIRFQEKFAAACALTIPVILGFASWRLRNASSIGVRTFALFLAMLAVGFGGAVLYLFVFMVSNPETFETLSQ